MTRERYVDIAKGFAMLCIVFLHFEVGLLPPRINVFIGSFMISTFYVVVGWLDAQRTTPLTIPELLRKRWRQLGIPYLWWTVIILAFDCILWACGYYDTYFMGREIYKSLTLRGIGTLWFLPALFGGELLWYLVRRNRWLIALTMIGIVGYYYGYAHLLGERTTTLASIIDAPFRTIDNMLGACVGIAGGELFWLICKGLKFGERPSWMLAVAGLLIGAIAYWCANYFPIPLLWSFAAPILGPWAIILLAKSAQNSRLLDYFDYWGRNSLILMVTHYSIVEVLCEIFNKYVFHDPRLDGWTAIAFFVVTMIVEYPIALLINRHLLFTLGKTKLITNYELRNTTK